MKESISIGLIGFGTVGCGVVKLLQEEKDLFEKRVGARLVLQKVADLDISTPRPVVPEPGCLTTDAGEVIANPEIDIVVELMGGYEPAHSFLVEAIRAKKHVVTANKALIATHGNDLFRIAEENGVDIGFEASVGGTIPIIRTIKESLVANRIESIFGIMNGTSNFILTKMTDDGESFAVVLKEAQRLGFAEADPTFDVEGIDASHKLAILVSLAYGKNVSLEEIYVEGITGITEQDIAFARELGYRIKLLGIAVDRGDAVEARVHPTMIPFSHLLANVNTNYNAFHIVGSASGPIFLYGQGAGMMPTASAVMSDIVDIARNIRKGTGCRVPARSVREKDMSEIRLRPFDEVRSNYYFRFTAVDRPGVLSKISGILGERNISISTVIQKGRTKEGAVPVVMTTYKARERDVREALQAIDRLDVVLDKTVLIRVEDDEL
ncbi:MAG: homoserine dehydrogenase [Deltaproteobacteria bacterium]|jgi:homoserine dehydrogenase|nr:homoserine dehydrogenase [Deltaproteobacteria bacterium]